MCVTVMVTMAACDLVDTNTPTQRAAAAIDGAIAQITNQSSQWQAVLQNTVAQLTDQAQSTIRNEVQNLLDRTVAVTIANFQCGIVDFLSTRVIEHLQAIKAHVLGQPVPTRHPTFCQPVPSSVDVNLVKSNRPDHVDFFGYDFDTTPGIKVYLESTNGSRVDVTSKLIMNTAFQVTVPFGANGVQLTSQSKAIRLNWSGTDYGSIAVLQPSIPLCIESAVSSNTFGKTTSFIPALIAGDSDFWQGGNVFNGPSPLQVGLTVTTTVTQHAVTASIGMRAAELTGDTTTVSGETTNVLYQAPLGGRIESVIAGGGSFAWSTPATGKVFGDTTQRMTNGPDKVVTTVDIGGFTGGPITFPGGRGSDPGHAAGTTAGVEVTWNSLTVKVLQPPPGYSTCT